jgi:hypothetical protein
MVHCGATIAVLLAGCSWSSSSTLHPTVTSSSPRGTCKRTAPVADLAIGAGLLGASLGTLSLASQDPVPMLTISGLLIGTGIAFLASAQDGYEQHDACSAELLASYQPQEPVHLAVVAAPSCEQRRLDMYSRAVTGADPDQRARLLHALPACDGTASREHAWELTKTAALAAGAGNCGDIEAIAREVYVADIALHDVVLMADVEIKYCLSRREL